MLATTIHFLQLQQRYIKKNNKQIYRQQFYLLSYNGLHHLFACREYHEKMRAAPIERLSTIILYIAV
jgi:hypothetical protein